MRVTVGGNVFKPIAPIFQGMEERENQTDLSDNQAKIAGNLFKIVAESSSVDSETLSKPT